MTSPPGPSASARRGRLGVVGLVGPVLDLGPRVRVVVQPPRHPHAGAVPTAATRERPSGSSRGLEDAGDGADVGADVAAAHLATPARSARRRTRPSPARQSLHERPGSGARTRAAAARIPGTSTEPEREHRAATGTAPGWHAADPGRAPADPALVSPAGSGATGGQVARPSG